MIVCAGSIENFSFAYSLGVGMVQSSIELTKLILRRNIKEIIFVGSGGSYGRLNLFDIVESMSASNIEHSFLLDNSYTPIDNLISLAPDVSHETIVNSSNYITINKDIGKKYLALNIDIENMEFFSCVSIAKHFNIFVRGIFVITNFCDKNAHTDFLKNKDKAYSILEDYIQKKLHK